MHIHILMQMDGMKKVIIILIISAFFLHTSFIFQHKSSYVRADSTLPKYFVDDDFNSSTPGWGNDHFDRIQAAIDKSSIGDRIIVYEGTYEENIVINKAISLFGEDVDQVIIDGGGEGSVVLIDSSNVDFSTFTIQNSGHAHAGIDVQAKQNNISNNIIIHNHFGISSKSYDSNTIFQNTFEYNDEYGVYLQSSNNNIVKNNVFRNNDCAMRVKARYNTITENKFENNSIGLHFCCFAERNEAYRNNFINNSESQGLDSVDGATWYSVKDKQGNYWDDYKGVDADGDGIGDTPYDINFQGTEQDKYPLMTPWSISS